ncbi:MAG TPA: hypothetical protein DD734_04940 [Firmicutes bacterium]|nr:hypothetical protein [Bacillota bacterium]
MAKTPFVLKMVSTFILYSICAINVNKTVRLSRSAKGRINKVKMNDNDLGKRLEIIRRFSQNDPENINISVTKRMA